MFPFRQKKPKVMTSGKAFASLSAIRVCERACKNRQISSEKGLKARREGITSQAGSAGHRHSTLSGLNCIGIAAPPDFRVFQPARDPEELAEPSAWAIVLAEQDALVFGEERVAGIGFGQDRHYLDDAPFADARRAEILGAPNDYVGEDAGVQVAVLALHIDRPGLLYHAVIVVYPRDAADLVERPLEAGGRNRLVEELLPAAAVEHGAFGEVWPESGFAERLVEMLPDDGGEPEKQDIFPKMFPQECGDRRLVEVHVFVERIDALVGEQGEPENARATSGKCGTVLQHGGRIENQHRQAFRPDKGSYDPGEGLGLASRRGLVQEDSGDLLSGCAGRGHGDRKSTRLNSSHLGIS